jgi:pimeloyl-ACP methyl ester carboxylesterase
LAVAVASWRQKLMALMSPKSLTAAWAASLLALASVRADEGAHWATVNGHRLYYEIHGSGSPVLLLHGGGGSIVGAWSRQIVDFSPTREVIAPEQVGNGHTPDVPGPATYAAMTEDTAALLQQLQVKNVDVVGWSDGGIIALMLAVRHPDLVRRVVATGANVDPTGMRPKDLAGMRAAQPDPNPVAEKLRQLWMNRPAPDELTFDLLKTIRAKVLIMAGDHDEITLEHTLKIYQAIPAAQLWILPNTGHATFVDRPDWTDPMVLAFLK